MPDDELYVFDNEDSDRIAKAIPIVEQWAGENTSKRFRTPMDNPEVIYCKLTAKDPDGKNGYWSAKEARYISDEWEAQDNGRAWDGTSEKFPYIRHYRWDDAEVDQIVKVFKVINNETGKLEWVFDTNVTNPEGLVFYSDKTGGTGQAKSDSQWTTKVGAKVLTNVGESEINPGFTIGTGDSAQVVITFTDTGNGYVLTGAAMQTGQGQYWTEDNGVIIVRWRIAEVEALGDVGRLKQYHSGDIHIEIYAQANDDDDDDSSEEEYTTTIQIFGDGKWIDVAQVGKTYTISHRRPNPKLVWKTLEVNKNGGGFYTIEVDRMGHVVSVDGEELPVEDEVYYNYTSSLVSSIVGSDVRPEAIGGSGISVLYKLFEDGNNFPDWINAKSSMCTVVNDIGQALFFSKLNVEEGAMSTFNRELLLNVAGTAGTEINELFLGAQYFRFNASITLAIAVVGRGLRQTQQHSTATCTATNTISSTIVRDKEDPNNNPFTVTVSYSLANLESTYKTKITFKTQAGVEIPYIVDNFVAGTGSITAELDATSATAEQSILFDFESMGDNKPATGDPIIMTSKLLTITDDYDANVEKQTILSYQSESECTVDMLGETVTDGTNDCVTDVSRLYRSDDFSTSSLNTTRWDTQTGTQLTYGGNVVKFTATDSSPEFVQNIQQTGLTVSGDFLVSVNVVSSDSDGSDGFANQLTLVIGGSTYGVSHYKNGSTLGYYYLAGGSWTYSGTSTGTTISNVPFEISRTGSTVTIKANGSTIHTATQSGNITSASLTCGNNGAGRSGAPSITFDDFNFEAPIGVQYYT